MDLRGVLPGSKGPDGPTLAEIYRAARAAFPGVRIGGGTFAFFTELNRKRPPTDDLDFVTHTTCPIVHAADDVSVMETLEALPYVVQSAKAFITARPIASAPARSRRASIHTARPPPPIPTTARVPRDMDPRQRGLFGAAWTSAMSRRSAAAASARSRSARPRAGRHDLSSHQLCAALFR
jgi:hypothetical protein